MKFDFAYPTQNLHPIDYDELVVGYERTWEYPVTFADIAWYADLSEDGNRWYTVFGSPWGPPVCPPLLMSRLGIRTTDPQGRLIGFLNTWNRTETLAPTRAGTVVRFRGRITGKFERNGRRVVRLHVDAEDAETGEPLLREEKEYVAPAVDLSGILEGKG
jgi:acyl dehydratase